MVKKTIRFDMYIKTSEQTPTYSYAAKQKVMSNDKDSTQITFNLLDVSPDELSGSSASILLYMQDGSFFQSSDVTIDRNSVIYTMKEEETKHSGNTKVQIVLKKGTVQTASLIYNFEIEKGLEKYPITEVMIQDWTTLTEEAKAFVEQIEGFTLESFVENKMGEELANLETNYATRLTGLEQKDNQLTAQLAQTEAGLDERINSVNTKTETISNLAESVSKVQKNLIQGNDILPISFKRISDQPSLTASEIGESELAFPTVIKASEHIENPIDNYYLYIGPHDNSDVDYATGIHLLTSPTVTGPWTHYGVVITAAQLNSEYHAAALDVVWRADKGCYYGYAHGNEGYNNINPAVWTQRSYVLQSTDGITWTKVKTDAMVEPGTSWYADSAIDYARVFKFKGKWVALAQGQRVGDSNQKQGFYYSDDGIEWYADINNPIDASTFGKSWDWLFSSCAFPVGDTIYILMTVPNTDDTERSLWLAKTTNGSDIELVVDGPVFTKEPAHEWESGRVEYPHVYIENGEMYLFYISDISLIGKPRYMGIAKISLEG